MALLFRNPTAHALLSRGSEWILLSLARFCDNLASAPGGKRSCTCNGYYR